MLHNHDRVRLSLTLMLGLGLSAAAAALSKAQEPPNSARRWKRRGLCRASRIWEERRETTMAPWKRPFRPCGLTGRWI